MLPVIQVLTALVVMCGGHDSIAAYVPTTQLVCWGLNAPALLLRAQAGWGPLSLLLPGTVLGVDISDLLFLMGVGAVWYFVGLAIDYRQSTGGLSDSRILSVIYPLLFALGALLFVFGLTCWTQPRYNNPNYPILAILVWSWSATLVFVSAKTFVRVMRRSGASR